MVSFVLGLASFVISIWGLVELGFLRGTVGPNPYGPDPLQAPAARFHCARIRRSLNICKKTCGRRSAAATSATIRTRVTRFSVGRLQCVLFLR